MAGADSYSGCRAGGSRPAPGSALCAVVVIVDLGGVRVAKRAQVLARGGGGEAVAAQDVEVLELQRRQAGDILIADLVALGRAPARPARARPTSASIDRIRSARWLCRRVRPATCSSERQFPDDLARPNSETKCHRE